MGEGFNTVNSRVLEREAHRNGDRVGIPLAGDSQEALELVATLVRDAGFDPVIVGGLARGKEFEPDTAPYNTGMSGQEMTRLARTEFVACFNARGHADRQDEGRPKTRRT